MGPLVGIEERQHREHPTVILVGGRQLELRQDAADMLFDGALADKQPMGDSAVRTAFGHEREHLPLSCGEHRERVGPMLLAQQLLNEDGVDHGTAERDPFKSIDKILDLQDPALEQIADAVAAPEKVDRGLDLNVPREEQDSDLGELAANRARYIDALKEIGRAHV